LNFHSPYANRPEDVNLAVGERPVSRGPGVYINRNRTEDGNERLVSSFQRPRCLHYHDPKRRQTMRFFLKISIPVEAGNAAAKADRFKAIQQILEDQKPEAAYFLQDDGKRTAILIVNMEEASQLAEIVEPWFLALNASVECKPVMVAGDLQKAFPALERAVKSFS
jgi:hypothetical protein